MGTLQTTFRCWGEGEPSSEMSDDSDGDGEMSCGGQFTEDRRIKKLSDVLAWVKGGNWSIDLAWSYGCRRRERARRSLLQWEK
jgi:hypothetical protein